MQFVLANLGENVMEKLHRSNALESFGSSGLYLTVGGAEAEISSIWKAEMPKRFTRKHGVKHLPQYFWIPAYNKKCAGPHQVMKSETLAF